MDECDWTSCRELASLDLIAGSCLSAARVVGSFCVPHASLASIDVQTVADEPTWYDWHRSACRPHRDIGRSEPVQAAYGFARSAAQRSTR